MLEEVREIALNNEYIILFVGTTESLESEGRERPHMNIPHSHLKVFEKKDNYIVSNAISYGSQHRLINHIIVLPNFKNFICN